MTEAPAIPVHFRRDRFDPVPEIARLRTEQPVSRVELAWGSAWLVTRYDDVRTVLGDPTTYGSRSPGGPPVVTAGMPARNGFLLGYDPPEHTRLRRLLTPEFTVRRIRRLQPRIEAIVAEHLDAMQRKGSTADLVADFALPIPSLVICELLGVPYADRAEFQRHSAIRLNVSLDIEIRGKAIMASREYMAGLVAEKRANPGDDMIGMLIREHGDEVEDEELTGVGDLLLLAGHETTSNMLALGTLLLLQHPEVAADVRAGRNVDETVEEMLRYLSVVHNVLPRTVQKDVVLSGQEIAKGDVVICSLASANRDPGFEEGLDSFDPVRKLAAHLAFGHGIHHCLGAPLARMEMRMAYPALLQRFPALRPAVPVDELQFRGASFVYGLEEFPVSLV